MIDIKEHLKELIQLPGLSGNEEPIRRKVADAWTPLVDEISTSRVGSLHGFRRGNGSEPRRRILLAAHMDAIGLMVTTIRDGFMHITEIGGVDPRVLPGQQVIVHGRRDVPGVINPIPDRLMPGDRSGEPPRLKDLLVDTGLPPADVEKLVRPGDLVSFAQLPVELSGGMLAGHTLDNRASVAALTGCLQELQHIEHEWDVWVVATTQEEESYAGAYTSPFTIKPDIAIAIDVTFAKGPGSADYRSHASDKGPTIGWGPNVHPALHKRMKTIAENLDIPHQLEVMPRHSGTDAFAMQVVEEGIPTLVLGIPLRYMHTPVESVVIKDIERAGHLLAEFIARLDANFMDGIQWDQP